MNAAAKRHRPTCMAPTRTLSAVGERLLRDSRSDSAVDGSNEHTSTRAHNTQPIPPQKNLTIRGSTSPAAAQKYVTNTHQDAPPSRAAPQKTPHPTPRLKRRQWARSSPQHTRKKDMPNPPPRRNRLATNQRAQNVVHYTPNTPCHPHTTEVDCTLSNHPGVLRP